MLNAKPDRFDSYRQPNEGEIAQRQLAFIEFTTGTPHPLSQTHTVSLPPFSAHNDVFIEPRFLGDDGDYILVSARSPNYVLVLYLVAWKTGVVTFVSDHSKVCLSLTHVDLYSSASSLTCVRVWGLLLESLTAA